MHGLFIESQTKFLSLRLSTPDFNHLYFISVFGEMAFPAISSPIPSRVHSLALSDISLGFLDDFFATVPDINSIEYINDIAGAIERLPSDPVLQWPPNTCSHHRRFALRICSSMTGSPPKLVIDCVKSTGCLDDCDPITQRTLDLANKINASATAMHRQIDEVPSPSKGAASFAVNAVVLNRNETISCQTLNITPHIGGKSQLGTSSQRQKISETLGDATWYLSVFAQFNVLFITPKACLKPTLIEQIHLRRSSDDTPDAVFFEVNSGQKQVSLALGKYNFLFDKSSTTAFVSLPKRKRESDLDVALCGASLRACITETKVAVVEVLAALHSFPAGTFDITAQRKFEHKLTLADDRISFSMVVQLAKYLEESDLESARDWVKICGMF